MGGRQIAQATVRPDGVVVAPPFGQDGSGMGERTEQRLVGVKSILLIGGDPNHPVGPFSGSFDTSSMLRCSAPATTRTPETRRSSSDGGHISIRH
jgi:hypothetical protein